MIEFELSEDLGVLIIRPQDSLTAEDFENVAKVADPYIAKHGKLNGLMIEANRFPGWKSLAGLVAHVRFVHDHHRKISHVAVVTDDSTLSALPAIGRHFVAAEVRHFTTAQREEALQWLGES